MVCRGPQDFLQVGLGRSLIGFFPKTALLVHLVKASIERTDSTLDRGDVLMVDDLLNDFHGSLWMYEQQNIHSLLAT